MGVRTLIYPFLVAVLLLAGGCSTTDSAPPSAQSARAGMDHSRDFYVAHKGIGKGYELIFHVMPAPEDDEFSRSQYHLMVSV